jgi:hypothetical protein
MKLRALWSDPVWSKVIAGGVLTVLSLAGAYCYSQFSHKSHQNIIAQARDTQINGSTWQGMTSSIDVPGEDVPAKSFLMTFHFIVKDDQITGIASFEHDGQLFEISFKGEFFNESYLKLEYVHLKGVNAFGYIILKLDQIPTTMSGKCVVYGSVTHQISVGKIDLKKIEH